MALKPFKGFLGPSNAEASLTTDAEDLVCFLLTKPQTPNSRVDYWMRGTPGLEVEETFSDPGAGRSRGSLGLNGYVVEVMGTLLYVRDVVTGVWSQIPGDAIPDDGLPVQIAANKTQVFIVGGGKGLIWEGPAITLIADPDFPGNVAGQTAYGAVELDGYFITLQISQIAAEASLAKFYISSLNDGTAWDSLEFGSVPVSANALIGLLVDHRKLWVFGNLVSQVFFNSGNIDFPFEPIDGGVVDQGLANINCVAAIDNTPWWLGVDKDGHGIVWRANGYLPLKMSTPAIETAISGLDFSDAVMWTMQDQGHSILVLSFPTSQKTYALDTSVAGGYWFQWPYFLDGQYYAHRAANHAFQGGVHYVGDRETATVYKMSFAYKDDAGQTIRRVRTAANIVADMERVSYHNIRFDMQTGEGLSDGSSPTMGFLWSDDGGKTWVDEQTLQVGAVGEYDPPFVEFDRMGQGYNRVFRIICTAPIDWYFSGAFLDARKGVS